MRSNRLTVGDILIYVKSDERYRIIQIFNFECLLIRIDISKMMLTRSNLDDIASAIDAGLFILQEENTTEILINNKDKIYETRFNVVKAVMDKIDNNIELLIDSNKGALIKEIADKLNVSHVFVYKYLRIFLQGGMNYQVLYSKYSKCGGRGKEKRYDTKKAGRISVNSALPLSNEVIDNFDKMLNYYFKMKCKVSKKDLYEKLLMDFYTQEIEIFDETEYVLKPISQIPSKRQFYYWINKRIDKEDKYRAEFGSSAVKNDIRPLKSDTLYRNYGAGYCFEMDEMETDYYLVSYFDRSLRIGRAILYIVIDTYSKEIVGISIGLNNNSWLNEIVNSSSFEWLLFAGLNSSFSLNRYKFLIYNNS